MSTTLPNMGLKQPTRGPSGSGIWDDDLDENALKTDSHDHSTGKGVTVKTAGISIDADLTFSSLYAPIGLHRLTFASIVALSSSNKSLFVNTADNELYWRSNAGTNVKLTLGSALNVAAFTGGIGGDYTAVAAALNYDNSGTRYTLRGASGTNWARMASGDVRLFETGTSETVFVGLAAPSALAGSYTITMPLAAPSSTSYVSMDSSGVLTASNSHGDRVLSLSSYSGLPDVPANVSYNAPGLLSLGAVSIIVNIPLVVGDRLKSFEVNLHGNAPNTADVVVELLQQHGDGTQTVLFTTTVSNVPGGWTPTTSTAINHTFAATKYYLVRFTINAAGIQVGYIAVTYDRP